MKRFLLSIWYYIKNLWEGKDGKPSIRTVLAIWLTYDFIRNLHYAIEHCLDRIGEIAMSLGIEASLIAAMLALKLYENIKTKISNGGSSEAEN